MRQSSFNTPGLFPTPSSHTVVRLALGQHNAPKVLAVKHNVGYITSYHNIKVLQQPLTINRHAPTSLATHIRALLLVVLRPDEVLRELESLSLTIKSMFFEREDVPVLNPFVAVL